MLATLPRPRDRTASPTKLLSDGRPIKVKLLANQAVVVEDENQNAFDPHGSACWGEIGKRAEVRTAPHALDNHGVIGVASWAVTSAIPTANAIVPSERRANRPERAAGALAFGSP